MTDSRASNQRSRFAQLSLSGLREEAGYALVEVMVSAVLLVVVGLATFSLIDQSAGRSSSNRARAVAVSLAEQDQERMRATPWATLETLNQSQPKTVNGVAFTIASKADYVSDSSGVFECSTDTGGQQYLLTTSTVTWPNMNGIDPVKVESLVSPNVSQSNFGSVTATIKKANGDPQSGIQITVAGITQTTSANGCVQWTKLPPGPVTLSFGQSPYYTEAYAQSVSESFNVKAGESSNKSYTYDRLSTFTTSLKRLSDGANSRWPTVRLLQGLTLLGDRPNSTNTTPLATLTAAQMGNYSASVVGYFPDPDGYRVYAGKCDGNNPENYMPTFYAANPTGASAPPVAGVPNPLFAFTRKVTINVKKATTTSGTGARLDGTVFPFIEIKPVSPMPATGCEQIARFRVANGTGTPVGGTTPAALTNPLATVEKRNNSSTTTDPGAYTARVVVELPWGVYSICADNDTVRRKVATYNNTPPGSTTYPPTADTFTLDLGVTTGTGDPAVPSTRTVADCS